MANDPRVQTILEEIVASDRTPEEVCSTCPELLAVVRVRLARLRAVEAEVAAAFPTRSPNAGRAGAILAGTQSALPSVVGYTVLSVLGRGGMGVVYKAHHHKLNRLVAMKMLLSGGFAAPAELARFTRESQAVAGLRHPHIVQVYEVGDIEGRPYFTMEHMEGGSLAQGLAGAPQPIRDSATMVATLADAVQVAHDGGIIHRDLKPANVLLTSTGTPKITDFGLARRYGETTELTLGGTRLGTPSYMSPEQAIGREGAIGPPTDIYSLGAVLYEMLTGRPPFRADTPAETERQLLSEEPARPSQLNAKIPRDLETICLTCLRKNPQRRYATASDLATDLRRFLSGEPIAARRTGTLEKVWKWVRRHPEHATIIGGSSLGVASVVVAMVWIGSQRAAIENAVADDLHQVAQLERASDWAGSKSAIERARGRLGNRVVRNLQQRIEQVDRNLAFVALLDDTRLNRATFSPSAVGLSREESSLAYRRAFETAGLLPGGLADDAAVIILDSDIREAIVAAMDDWMICAQEERDWILHITSRVDPDPWRTQVRNAVASENRVELERLAADAPVGAQPVRLLLALAASLQKSGGDSVPLLRVVQQLHPDDFWANFGLGSSLVSSAPEEATGFLRSAVALRPDAAPPRFDLANTLIFTKHFDEAIVHLQQVLDLSPEQSPYHRRAFANFGLALQATGRPEAAIARYREALRIDPGDAKTRFNLGFSLASLGRFDEAIREYHESLKSYPNVASAHHNLALALEATHDEAGAIKEYEEAIRLDPRYAPPHVNLGRLLRSAGRLRDAAQQFQTAVDLVPRDFDVRNELRGVLMRLGESERVRAEWHDQIASDPPDHPAWDGYAELCLFLGRESEYHRTCRDLFARFGATTDPHIAERTGRACLLRPTSEEDIRRAAVLVDVAINADQSQYEDWAPPFFQFAKGLAEYRLDHLQKAIAIMDGPASTVLGPAPGLVAAMAQHRLGKEREARHTLAVAILKNDWSPENADIRDAWMCNILRREAETLILPDLPAFLDGRHQPRDNDERLALLGVCQFQRRLAASARLYAGIFAADPQLADNLNTGLRYKAACAAALAGTRVEDGRALAPEERSAWRQQARQWLLADASSLRTFLQIEKARPRIRQVTEHWLADPNLAGIRDPSDMNELGSDERAQCALLWAEVEDIHRASQDVK